jgi:hypothetical protein
MAALIWAVPAHAKTVNGLRTADEFNSIADQTARSSALFEEMFVVIENQRCLNCHPVGDVPMQGNMMTPHQPTVVRGVGDFGAPGRRSPTCYGAENVAVTTGESSIPGHSPWQLAPIEMR